MGGLSSLGRAILVILNIIFLLVSLALIAGGSILRFTPGTILSFVVGGISQVVPDDLNGAVTIPKNLDFVPMFGDIGVALLVSGVILFVLSFLACCGACCKWRPFLILFVIIVIVIIVVLAIIGGLFLVKDSILHKNIRDSLSDKAAREHEDAPDGSFSQIMNVLALEMKCCGFSGPRDYGEAWNTSKITLTFGVDYATLKPIVPWTCCKTMGKICASSPGPFYEKGCYDKLMDMLEGQKKWAIVALVVLLLLLVIEVIFAVIIVVDIGKNKVGPI